MSVDVPTAADPARADRLRRDVLVVGGVGFLVRLIWVVYSHRAPGGLNDPLLYQRFAQGIARGDGYVSFFGKPTAYYPPGYPYFLGALQWLSNLVGLDDHLTPVAGVVQAVLGGVAAGALVVAGRRLGASWGPSAARRIGIAAGVVLALWPNLVLYAGVLLSETLFVACLAVFLAAALSMTDEDGSLRTAPTIVAAASLGAATLVRPQVLVVLPALVVAWFVARRGWRAVLRDTALLVVGVVVALSPWIVRNAVVLDAFVPLSNNGGDNMCVGFHPGATGHFEVPAYCDTGEFYTDGPAAELRRESETRSLARRWATHHLSALPGLSIRKLWYTYHSDGDGLRAVESYEADRFLPDGLRTLLRWTATIGYLVVVVAAAIGTGATAVRAWRERGRDPVTTAVLAMTALSVLVPIAFFGDARFKVAVTPFLALLAGVGIDKLGTLLHTWNSVPSSSDPEPSPDSSGAPAPV
jgi:4-amino-4-deoxy-L-arabinose transferase-like glycosyltransferase